MADTLKGLPQSAHPDLLVGFNKADDAGVFRIDDHTALVQTVDFFPPIVDDPYFFGQIAAANAISDIYAMGGKPLTALNIVGFPASDMPKEILRDILRGGADKIEEAGAVVVGGHSIKDKELKYGVAVTGIIDPAKIVTNSGARPGDRLYLTKRLGTGIVTTAIKRNAVSDELTRKVTEQMAQLNRAASELMVRFEAHAATDITGYGLLGHALEMAEGSDVTIEFTASSLPVIEGALELAGQGMNPGGANDNREFLSGKVTIASTIDSRLEQVLYDPQTSGGLLISIAPDRAPEFEMELANTGLLSKCVGRVDSRKKTQLVVLP